MRRAIRNGTSPADTNAVASIQVFPVPVRDNLNIQSTENIQRVFVSNANGQVVFSKQYAGTSKVQINTSKFPEGAYFVKVVTARQTVTKKVLLSK
jgi:hypothetical protein